nr:ATP-binding protein [Rubellimicrobium aerolatum]
MAAQGMVPMLADRLGRTARRSPGLPVLVAAVAILGPATLLRPGWLGDSLVLTSALLFGVAILRSALALRRAGATRLRREGAVAALRRDPSVALLADGAGAILARSAGAAGQGVDGASLDAALSPRLADASAAVARLQARAVTLGSAEEEGGSRRMLRRLQADRIDGDTLLWRLDQRRAGDPPALPCLDVDEGGVVLSANGAFHRAFGLPAHHLDELAAKPPLVLGRTQAVLARVRPIARPIECLVVEISDEDGQRSVLFLPAPAPRDGLDAWEAVEDLPVPLLRIAPTGEILAANRPARLLLPMAAEPGTRMSEVLEGMGRPMIEWISDVAEGRPASGPQVLRGTGPHQDTVVRLTLSPAGPPEDRHLIGVLDDVSELKALEAQFAQSQKMQALGQLAGGVAHDFNNLLTAISGHCDLLLLRHDQGDPEYADLTQIRQNVNRAASLVGQLLAFSRKQSMMPETIDLPDALADLTHLLDRLVGERVRLTLDHDPSLLCIRADRRQLEQVVMNLVVNARDAMPEGGEIRIATGNVTLDAPEAHGRATIPPGRYVQVRVLDQGVGIPPDRLPKIFEPFYTTKRPGEGTGLGLSTAYGIVKQTGGYIFADSTVGQGTTFTLWFPAHDRPEPQPAPPPGQKPPASSVAARILLVEDEAPVRAFAARALRMRDHEVVEADSAEAALALLQDPALEVDLILSDVVLPDMDGPTWVRQALLQRPGVKVIFASGYAEEAFSEQKGLVTGSVFLPKPFSLVELTGTVERILA